MTWLHLMRRNLWLALITVLLAAGVAALVTLRAEPRYEARVTFYVTAPAAGPAPAQQLDQRIRSYAGLVTSDAPDEFEALAGRCAVFRFDPLD